MVFNEGRPALDALAHFAEFSSLRVRMQIAQALRLDFFFAAFFGTFLPARRASESPIAIACLRLVTFFPLRPLFNVPFLRSCIARPTFFDAAFEYRATMGASRNIRC